MPPVTVGTPQVYKVTSGIIAVVSGSTPLTGLNVKDVASHISTITFGTNGFGSIVMTASNAGPTHPSASGVMV